MIEVLRTVGSNAGRIGGREARGARTAVEQNEARHAGGGRGFDRQEPSRNFEDRFSVTAQLGRKGRELGKKPRRVGTKAQRMWRT